MPRRAAERHEASATRRSRSKRALGAEERARRLEQMRKDSVGAVYRRLARELHPDLEPDPVERERKSRIMQAGGGPVRISDAHRRTG